MCAMCGCNSEAFMGVNIPDPKTTDVNNQGTPMTFNMTGVDSINTLGAVGDKK